jgi:hypothetical protein
MKTLLACLLSIVAAAAQAQSPALQERMTKYAVRVETIDGTAAEGGVYTGQGSGVAVNANGVALIATNHHVIRESRGPITITYRDGGQDTAHVVAADADRDVAILAPTRPLYSAAPLADADDDEQIYYLAGFPLNGQLRILPLPRLPYGATLPVQFALFQAPVEQGESGGGIYNSRGQVVGVIWGCNADGARGTVGQPFREMIAAAGEPVQLTQYTCGPSGCRQPAIVGGPAFPRIRAALQPGRPAVRTTPPPAAASAPACAPASQRPARPPACDCRARLAAIEAELTTVRSQLSNPGRHGAQGERGPPGPPGEQGPPGKPAEINYAELSASIDVKAIAVAIVNEAERRAPDRPSAPLPAADPAEPASPQIYYGLFRKNK